MIARTWRALATPANADLYVKHFSGTVAPSIKALPGHCGAHLLRREIEGRVEFMAVTLWESRTAIEGFSGKDISHAHVEPEGRAVLESFDDFADHYEVAFKSFA